MLDGVEGVTTGLHICRGNDRSHFTGTEPYDEFAASIFPHTAAERLLLEYDDERSDMESAEELKQRIDDAAQYVPLERLALSTQCGFGSNAEGNAITYEAQRAKLELVVQVATDVWGTA